ncbi:hypothetical protein MLD52_07525 [Puniceicoccaceae bacterium K14]|nr:hypothetical protein [Puniceicoccaceae bacterium K14]
MNSLTSNIPVVVFVLLLVPLYGQSSDNSNEKKSPDETTQSPRERGRVLQKLNPIASEHQVFGALGSIPGSDADGEGVDYRSFFSNGEPFSGPSKYLNFSLSGNYNELSANSEFGGAFDYGFEFGQDGDWYLKLGARSSASDRIVEHYNSAWKQFGDSEGVYFLDRPRFSEDFIYTRNNVYALELHHRLNDRHRVYYKASYQDYFDNFYRNRLELQYGSGSIDDQSIVIGGDGESIVAAISSGASTRRYFGNTDTQRDRQHHVVGGSYEGEAWSLDYSVYYHNWEIEQEWYNWNFNDFNLDISYDIEDRYFPDYEVVSGEDLLETSSTRFSSLRIHDTSTKDEDLAARLDAERRVLVSDTEVWLQLGALYREKNRTNEEIRDVFGFDSDDPFYLSDVDKKRSPGDLIVDSTFQKPTGLDPLLAENFFFSSSDEFVFNDYNSIVESAAQLYEAFESVAGGYGLAVWENGDWAFEVGARYEKSNTDSVGRIVIPEEVNDPSEGLEILRVRANEGAAYSIIKDLSASNTYDNLIPSAEFEYKIGDRLKLRGGWFNRLMRPQYYNIVNYRRISFTTKTVSEGNPLLSPTKIEKSRLALITELDALGSFAFEVYSIDIEDFFYDAVSQENIFVNGVPEEYTVTRVENGKSGSIKGFEIQWRRGLDFIGLGEEASIQISYTYSDSEAEVVTRPNESFLLPERSEHLLKVDLRKKIGNATVSFNAGYQSEALDNLGASVYRDRYREDVISLAFTGSYKLNRRSNIGLAISGILDHPERSYDGSNIRVQNNQYSSWLAQLRYDFKI